MAVAKGKGRRKAKQSADSMMTIDAAIAHEEYLERRKAREERMWLGDHHSPDSPQPSPGKIVFPRSHEGDILAHAWVGTIHNPCKWLASYAEEKGFTPRKNPWTMSPAEQQAAVARIVCPKKMWGEYGAAVNFEQDPQTLYTSCVVILYSSNLLNFWTVKYQHFHGAHFYAAQGSVDDLRHKLATGEKGRQVIIPAIEVGLPIGDNLCFRT